MKKKEELGAIIIVNIAKNHRPEVNEMLLRNGVLLPEEASDLQVAQVLTELLKKSKTFKNEFLSLMANSDIMNNMVEQYSNATGDFSKYQVANNFDSGIKPLYASSLTSNSALTSSSLLNSSNTSPASNTSSTTNSTGKSILDKVLGIGEFSVNSFLKYNQNVTDQKLAEASIVQAQSGSSLDGYGNVNPDNSQGMGTGMIVFLTILVLCGVGGGVWLYMKNKK